MNKAKIPWVESNFIRFKKLWEVDFLCQGQATASWATPVVKGNRLIVPGRDNKNDIVFG